MATHTPGPWTFDTVRTSIGRAFRIGSGEMLSSGKGGCIIYDDYPGSPENERVANARLIASAPTLLHVCREALDLLSARHQNLTSGAWDDGEAQNVAVMLEDAIRRATQPKEVS